MAREFYNGNANLKGAGVPVNWTPERLAEFIKCKDDPIYFAETYMKIVVEEGLRTIILRDYQKDLLEKIINNRNILAVWARQSGKCCAINTKIKVKNKKTGEILETTIGEFHSLIKRENSSP